MTRRGEGRRASRVPILMYHSVSDKVAPGFRKFTVRPAAFAEQMACLAERGYEPVTVTQVASAIRASGSPLPTRPVALTFDDGFADFYAQVLPLLESNGFAATLYVSTAFVGGTGRWLEREGEAERPMLTWAQLQEIAASGIEIGAHGHTHRPLDSLPESDALEEIVRPKEILEQRLGRRVSSFAYPFGYYSGDVRQFVAWAGYSSACAVRYAMSSTHDDPFAIGRLLVTGDTDIAHFARLLEGRLAPEAVLHRLASGVWRLARRSIAGIGYRVPGDRTGPHYRSAGSQHLTP